MTDLNEYRERVAEAHCRAVNCIDCEGTGQTIQGWTDKNGYSEDQYGPCWQGLKVADALLAPGSVVAGIVAEAKRAEHGRLARLYARMDEILTPILGEEPDEDAGTGLGLVSDVAVALGRVREEGAAEVRARVEAVIEEEVQAAYFDIAVEKMLTVQTIAPGRAAVPPHWREAAEGAASVPVADLRAALETRPIPPVETGDNR